MKKKIPLTKEEIADFENKELCFGTEYDPEDKDCSSKECEDWEKCKALFNGAVPMNISTEDASEVYKEVDKKEDADEGDSKEDKRDREEYNKDSASIAIKNILKKRDIEFDIANTNTRDKFIVEGEQILVVGKRSIKFCSVNSGETIGIEKDLWEKSNVGFTVLYTVVTAEKMDVFIKKYLDKVYGNVSEVEEEVKTDLYEGIEDEEREVTPEEEEVMRKATESGGKLTEEQVENFKENLEGAIREGIDLSEENLETIYPAIAVTPENLKHGVCIYETTDGLLKIEILVPKKNTNIDTILEKVKTWFL